MFGSGNFRDKITLVIFENSEIVLILLGQFQNFQKCTRAIYPKHVITSTYYNIIFFYWGMNTHLPTYFLNISQTFFENIRDTSVIYCFLPP